VHSAAPFGGERNSQQENAPGNSRSKHRVLQPFPPRASRIPNNPRQRFEECALKELTESIKIQGVLSPILVRPLPEGFPEHFEIVTGARRFRAAKLAGLDIVPFASSIFQTLTFWKFRSLKTCNVSRSILWKRRGASVHSATGPLRYSQNQLQNRSSCSPCSVPLRGTLVGTAQNEPMSVLSKSNTISFGASPCVVQDDLLVPLLFPNFAASQFRSVQVLAG
jgi:ParB-like nuclease domain